MMSVVRKALVRVLRVYAYLALAMFVSGVIGGAWLGMSGNDIAALAGFLR